MSTPKTFSFSPFLRFSFSFLSFSLLFLLAACSTDMNDAAVTTVETYVQALADKNADQMIGVFVFTASIRVSRPAPGPSATLRLRAPCN